MSRRYLIPVKFTCDTYGCTGEAMGHEEFQLSSKYKLEQKSSSSDSLPEGWSQRPYEGDQCAACTTAHEERQAARIANFKQTVTPVTPGPLPGQPALHPGVAAAEAAVKLTRQRPAECRNECAEGCCESGTCGALDNYGPERLGK